MTFNETTFLQQSLHDNGHVVPDDAQEEMLHYLHMIRQWNRVFNLTRILDPEDMILLHLIDSLSISPYLHGETILDVGTGAGLPGIPLALMYPKRRFTLIDSNQKKVRFLNQVIYDLALPNVKAFHTRVEKYKDSTFDSILSRAFSSLKVMLLATTHLIQDQGRFLAMKGTYPESEIADIPPEFSLIEVHKLTIKGLNAERHLVHMEKTHTWEK